MVWDRRWQFKVHLPTQLDERNSFKATTIIGLEQGLPTQIRSCENIAYKDISGLLCEITMCRKCENFRNYERPNYL